MKTKSWIMVAGMFLATMGIGMAQTQFERLPDLPNNSTYSFGCAWGDYNGDGYIDLAVANGFTSSQTLDIYRNNKNSTFTRTTTTEVGTVVGESREWVIVRWADMNGDGKLDLLASDGINYSGYDHIYLNNGQGVFSPIVGGDLGRFSAGAGWALPVDYDRDGILDLLAHHSRTSMGITGRLYRGNGDGTLKLITPLPQSPCEANSTVWCDYDGDGDPDLFVPQGWARPDHLYRNEGNGSFTLVTTGLLVNTPNNSRNPAWGDYDNDGDLDLALTKSGGTSFLLRNDGSDFSYGPTLPSAAGSPLWFDFDNDGLLDLFFVQGQQSNMRNVLVRNNGDGTFTSVSDPITADWGAWTGASCGDFDNNGFLDMFVTSSTGRTALYRNLGNTNHWIKFKLTGTASNRDAFGAKVRVLATIRGQSVWQMREVSSGNYFQDEPRLNFGLGDATVVDTVRIEWPSGNVQELTSQTVDRIVTLTEQVYIAPIRPTASLGGSVTLTAQRAGPWQWYHDGVLLTGQTGQTLTLSNLQLADAGRYSVVTSSGGNLYTNFVYLFVDTQFTKINEGPPVTDLGTSGFEAIAGDYNGDGYEDLFVTRWNRGLTSLYQNNKDGTFTRIAAPPSQSAVDSWGPCAWGDFDNDGRLDLLAMRVGKPGYVYWSNGGGAFISAGFDTLSPWNVAVADYDRDGRLDLYFSYLSTPNRLYRNTGNRTFRNMPSNEVGPLANDSTFGGAAWADYDDDGWPDLCAPDHLQSRIRMFHNERNGAFTAVANAVTASGRALTCAWGDADNDGRLDLFVARIENGTSRLYRNLGNGVFQAGALSLTGKYNGASWADYDNDGFLDLFVSAYGNTPNSLFHNNGDGSFTRISTGSVVTELPLGSPTAGSYWGTWFDYDNDGFLDLYVVNGDDNSSVDTKNFLYHNNANSNAWLKVKLIGTTSNRDAVGAKVRVLATYAGQARSQRRDITGGDAINGGQNYAHFGIGNATVINKLKIEWPSGITEEFSNLAVRRSLTIVEPSLKGSVAPDGKFHVAMTMSTNRMYQLQASADLLTWTTLTNCTGSGSCEPVEYVDPEAPSTVTSRFYRMK